MSAHKHKHTLYLHYSGLVALSVMCLAPIWVMISTSFKNQVVIFEAKPIWFAFIPTLENYGYILTKGKFDTYLWNSLIVGVTSTILTLFLGGLCAYALARLEFKGRWLTANATLLIRMVPPAVIAVPAFALVMMLNVESDLMVLIFFYTALNLPFAIWLLFGFFKQIPVEMEEAAIIDGASPLQVFFKIILPMTKSGYAVAGIFTFRIAWNEFILALLLTGRKTRTLPVAAAGFITDTGVEWGLIMAMGTLIVIPPLLFTFFSARQIITGMTAGAVKG
ncbi:MAG: carbohydrate ABC transporter permease [Dehalococcoidales bacterium]|mgnify:CR=1 FL=1|nr:carbohydrate ABC transporter permease [Dehalococcoidales bacterium]MDP7108787.1 carbohydrate ABC transporter permease [Nitrospinaceae bacterium]MDP7624431.1 carbohydrate ABC transporter permease [Rhodospirillales bacterium]